MGWRCTCVRVFFNSDVEGSDCTSFIKIMTLYIYIYIVSTTHHENYPS